jgi:hypothetical protein
MSNSQNRLHELEQKLYGNRDDKLALEQGSQQQSEENPAVQRMIFDHNEPIILEYQTPTTENNTTKFTPSVALRVEVLPQEVKPESPLPPMKAEVVTVESQPTPPQVSASPQPEVAIAKAESKESATQPNMETEEFLADLQAIMNGNKTYDSNSKQVIDKSPTAAKAEQLSIAQSTPSVEAPKAASAHDVFDRMAQGIPPVSPAPAPTYSYGHSVFDQMEQSRAMANAIDQGTVDLALQQVFDEFDRLCEEEEKNKNLSEELGLFSREKTEIMTLNPVKKNVPQYIHYIWVGSNIPDNYWEGIKRTAELFQDTNYKILFWISRKFSLTTDAYEHNRYLCSPEHKNNVEHRDIDGLAKRSMSDIEKWALQIEWDIQPTNYGAISDIIRAVILDEGGGIYIDTDCSFRSSFEFLSPRYGFYAATGSEKNPDSSMPSNCVMASLPNGQYIGAYRTYIAQKYQGVRNNYTTNDEIKVYLRGDRDLTPSARKKHIEEKTLLLTGPTALYACADKLKISGIRGNNLTEHIALNGLTGVAQALAMPRDLIRVAYDNSWLREAKEAKELSFFEEVTLNQNVEALSKETGTTKIHFIWWGDPTGQFTEAKVEYAQLATQTPNEMAEMLAENDRFEIIFWLQEAYAHRFDLASSIRKEPSSQILEVLGRSAIDFDENWRTSLQRVINSLYQHNAFSAIKDLMSLIILYAHGGYYFDTTVKVDPDNQHIFLNGLHEYDSPRVVGRGKGRIHYHQIGLMTANAILLGRDVDAEDIPILAVPAIDVWAMYSPKGHESVKLMLLSYVSRCIKMGLYSGGKPTNFAGLDGNEIMLKGGAKDSIRNKLIGHLIIHSVHDGLLEVCCNGKPDAMNNYLWKTEDTSRYGAKMSLNELGILKYHAGTWRT